MNTLLYILAILSVINLICLIISLFIKKKNDDTTPIERTLLEMEKAQNETINSEFSSFRLALDQRFDNLDRKNQELRSSVDVKLKEVRDENHRQLESMLLQNSNMSRSVTESLENVRRNTAESLEKLRNENKEQLDKMRNTVDEKLQATLETRLSKSFEQVQQQLESVYKGLGEMQNLAKSVGDLSRVFTNVKSRGIWGEVQVNSILDEILTPDQFVKNFKPKQRSQEVVEFAIRLPGKSEGDDVYLPIDSKFPREDYENFVKAQEEGDIERVKFYQVAMKNRVTSEAKDIRDKYIAPPRTTDFAILFLPTESLYAEILSIPGFADDLQVNYRVTLAGPTTLSALINSLQMGFRTLAVEKRSHEVWKLFAQMRKQFSYFASSLEAAEKSLSTASNRLEDVSKRSVKLSQKLEGIELPESEVKEEIPLLNETV